MGPLLIVEWILSLEISPKTIFIHKKFKGMFSTVMITSHVVLMLVRLCLSTLEGFLFAKQSLVSKSVNFYNILIHIEVGRFISYK